jgi:hypothetical protein
MNNKICFVLPLYGLNTNYFEIFLNSVGKNKNNYDLLLITEEKFSKKLPDNIQNIVLNEDKIKSRISKALKDWFDLDITDPLPIQSQYGEKNLTEKESIRATWWNLCCYKFLYGDMFKEELEQYSYWGFLDNDIILGDATYFLRNFEDYDYMGFRGHFCFFKNSKRIKNILTNPNTWQIHSAYMLNALKEVKQQFFNLSKRPSPLEGWYQNTIRIYAEHHDDFLTYDFRDLGEVCDLYGPAEHEFQFVNRDAENGMSMPNLPNQYIEYINGKIFRVSEDGQHRAEHLYVHFMARNNWFATYSKPVSLKDLSCNLYCKITAPAKLEYEII